MSAQRTEITPELEEYICRNFSAEDEFLAALKRQGLMLKIPEISITPDQGQLLQFLIKSINAKNILEIGTLAGYSAIIMARALPDDGKLTTLETNNLHYSFAKEKVSEAGLDDKIELIRSFALDYIKSLEVREQFDLIFMDADKSNLITYVELCTPLLRKGGIIAVDNAFALGNLTVEDPEFDEIHKHRIKDVYAVREFNEYLRDNKNYFTSLLSLGDGMLISLKL